MSPDLVVGLSVRLCDGGVFVDVQVGAGVVVHDANELVGELVHALVVDVDRVVRSVEALSAGEAA